MKIQEYIARIVQIATCFKRAYSIYICQITKKLQRVQKVSGQNYTFNFTTQLHADFNLIVGEIEVSASTLLMKSSSRNAESLQEFRIISKIIEWPMSMMLRLEDISLENRTLRPFQY
jgi:hypothetical protein